MFSYIVLISVVSVAHGIRVHWNTNDGPIIPPTSTVPPVPKPPFRDPAPVWEFHSNDIEDPNPYVYVLPPPSRPRYNPDNVHDIYPTRNASPTNFGHYVPQQQAPQPPPYPQGSYNDFVAQHQPRQTSVVPQLAVQYVANIGNRYYAIVPSATYQQQGAGQYQNHNALKPVYWKGDLLEKPFGKYNAKLKKYKAFETKQKFIPYYTYVAPAPQRSTNVIATSVPPPPQQPHNHQQPLHPTTTAAYQNNNRY